MEGITEFGQSFYLPVANHFFTLKVEVINLHADGWVRAHFKESVIASYEIRIPDLNKEPFKADGSIRLPVACFDYKKCGLSKIGPINSVAFLEMQIVDMTRADAMIVYNPNREIFEDRPYNADYSVKDI